MLSRRQTAKWRLANCPSFRYMFSCCCSIRCSCFACSSSRPVKTALRYQRVAELLLKYPFVTYARCKRRCESVAYRFAIGYAAQGSLGSGIRSGPCESNSLKSLILSARAIFFFTLPDTLCAALAMFQFKWPSLLQFDEASHGDQTIIGNLRRLLLARRSCLG